MRYAISALPLSAAMSVGLRRDEAGLLEQGGEHDRRPRIHLRVRAAQIAQDGLHALQVRGNHLEDVTIVSSDVVALEHAGVLFHFAHARLIAHVVGAAVAHRDERGHRESRLDAIELDAVAEDVSRLLEALHALHDRRAGEPDFVGDRLVAGASVLRENAEDTAIDGVELSLRSHLGGLRAYCRTIRHSSTTSFNVS